MLIGVSASQTHAPIIPPADFPSCRDIFTTKRLPESVNLFFLCLAKTSVKTLSNVLGVPTKRRPDTEAGGSSLHSTGLTRSGLFFCILHSSTNTPTEDKNPKENRQADHVRMTTQYPCRKHSLQRHNTV